MNRAEASSVVAYLLAGFRVPATEETVAVWVDQLRPISYRGAELAVRRAVLDQHELPSIHSFIELAQQEARVLAARDARDTPTTLPGEPALFRCGTCLEGGGMVVTGREGRWTVRPCPACNPQAAQQWDGGHFDPDHTCPECEAQKGRRRKKADA